MPTFLEQSIEAQKAKVATLEQQQVQYDAAANALSPQYTAARRALKDAQANPATQPAELAQLQSNYDNISNQYFTARDQASANQLQLSQVQDALAANLLKVNDPKQNVSFSTPEGNVNTGGTTTAASTGADPQVNKTTQLQANTNSGAIPPGQNVTGTTAPGSGEDPFEQSRQEAQAKTDQQGPTSQDVIDAEEDPFERSRMEAAQRASEEGPTEQAVIDAEEDPFERERMAAAQRSTNEVPVPQPEPDPNEYQAETNRLKAAEDAAITAEENQSEIARLAAKGTSAAKTNTNTEATDQDQKNFAQFEDWRVRLSLAQGIKALYKVDGDPGILRPLVATNGIVFPYTPNISVQYAAHYDGTDLTHSNYKIFQYKNSSVDNISISCDFTAQDTAEANYLLAVIHFLRSVTKMFYGQDQNPKRGTPPPLCYLTGLGSFQFDNHPLAITQFTYNLPTDVDYIRAGTETTLAGVNKGQQNVPNNSVTNTSNRLTGNVGYGGQPSQPKFKGTPGGTVEPTYVPTKMQIQISAYPIITRNDISNNFSLKDYATGELLRGMKGKSRISGGIW